jgi:formylglycine-generating enzyme required for sulfatase activity
VAALDAAFKPSPLTGGGATGRFGRTSPLQGTESHDTLTATPHETGPAIPGKTHKTARLLLAAAIISVLMVAAVVFISRRTPPPANSSTGPPGPRPLPASLTLPAGDMVLVAGGEGLLGPERKPVRLGSFYIDRTEVTNQAYLSFCRAVGHPVPREAERSPPGNPVVNVTFDDAQAFAQWAGKRLPTASEWEKAARGSAGQAYPWGNEWKDGVANIPTDSRTTPHLEPADAFASGASAYGVLNALGNAWEWVSTPDQPDDKAFQLLREKFKDLQPPLLRTEPMYQIRGGSFRRYLIPDLRMLLFDGVVMPARASMDDLGFRCVKDP